MAQRPILERKNVFGARLIERRAAQLSSADDGVRPSFCEKIESLTR